jgi:hypothetical protein
MVVGESKLDSFGFGYEPVADPCTKAPCSTQAVNFCMLLVTDYWILMNNVLNGFCQVTLP